jgi:cell division protein FtsN
MEPPLSPGKPGPEPADSRTSARKASDPASLERALTDQERARDEQLALERERGTLRARVGKTLGGSPTAEETEPGAQRPPDRKEGALKAEAAPPSQGKHDAAERARKTAERPLPKAPASLKTTPPPGEDPGPGERLGSARPRKEKHALADGTGEKDRAPSRQDPPGASSIPDNGSAEPSSQRYYRVRVGRFKSRKAAEEAREQLFDKTGHGAEVVPVGDDYRLQVGAYEEKSAAQKVAEELRSSEFDADVRNNDGAVVKRRTPPAKRRTRTRTAVKTGAKAGDKE